MTQFLDDEFIVAHTYGSSTLEQGVSLNIPFSIIDIYGNASISEVYAIVSSKSGRDASTILQGLTLATVSEANPNTYSISYTVPSDGKNIYVTIKVVTATTIHWIELEPYTLLKGGI